jgi:hypothetical protein
MNTVWGLTLVPPPRFLDDMARMDRGMHPVAEPKNDQGFVSSYIVMRQSQERRTNSRQLSSRTESSLEHNTNVGSSWTSRKEINTFHIVGIMYGYKWQS